MVTKPSIMVTLYLFMSIIGVSGGPPVVSPLLYQSYEEQQYAEISNLFPVVVPKDMPILLGDFNHGPASPGNITWEAPFLYGLMNARGFYSPYVLSDGRCTFCTSNPTTSPFPSDILIDHIYLPTNMKERVISSRVSWGSAAEVIHYVVNYIHLTCMFYV